MPKAHRHQRLAARTPVAGPETAEYEILDPNHRPDMRGEALSGAKSYWRDGRHMIRLTPSQAEFYITSGALARVLDA